MCLYSKPMWYAGKINRTTAKQLVQDGGKGSFLVRMSEEDHSYSLIVADKGQVSTFLIQENEDGSCQFGSHRFKSLSALAHKIGKSGLKGKGGKLHLINPISSGTTEPYELATAKVGVPRGKSSAGKRVGLVDKSHQLFGRCHRWSALALKCPLAPALWAQRKLTWWLLRSGRVVH